MGAELIHIFQEFIRNGGEQRRQLGGVVVSMDPSTATGGSRRLPHGPYGDLIILANR
jgi:hypothetical protein